MKHRKKFEFWRSTVNRQWYFHLKAGNGRIIVPSEGYLRRSSCLKAIAAQNPSGLIAVIEKV